MNYYKEKTLIIKILFVFFAYTNTSFIYASPNIHKDCSKKIISISQIPIEIGLHQKDDSVYIFNQGYKEFINNMLFTETKNSNDYFLEKNTSLYDIIFGVQLVSNHGIKVYHEVIIQKHIEIIAKHFSSINKRLNLLNKQGKDDLTPLKKNSETFLKEAYNDILQLKSNIRNLILSSKKEGNSKFDKFVQYYLRSIITLIFYKMLCYENKPKDIFNTGMTIFLDLHYYANKIQQNNTKSNSLEKFYEDIKESLYILECLILEKSNNTVLVEKIRNKITSIQRKTLKESVD